MLPIAAPAQTNSLPVLTPTQTLTPTDQETYPTPGSYPYDLLFGASLALDEPKPTSGEVSLTQDWLAINGGADNIVYHSSQKEGADMFVPVAHTGPDIFGFTMKLHGHTMVVGTGVQEEFPPGAVYVYDLKDKPE